MFKIPKIKALQDNTPSRNLANEFINEQGSLDSDFRCMLYVRTCHVLESSCKHLPCWLIKSVDCVETYLQYLTS